MGVFFQLVQHDVTRVFKQIHGTPFLGTPLPQLAKFGLGVDTMDELVRMKWACFIQEGRSSSPPSDSGPGLSSPLLRWSVVRGPSLPPHIPPRSLSGSPPSTCSRFGVVVVGLQLGAGPSGPSLVHWWGVVWLACLGLGLWLPLNFFSYHTLDVICV